jgi:hypothetical protein
MPDVSLENLPPYKEGKPPYYDYSKNQWAKKLQEWMDNEGKRDKLYNEKVEELTDKGIDEIIRDNFTKEEWDKIEKAYFKDPEVFEKVYSSRLEEYATEFTQAMARRIKEYGYLPRQKLGESYYLDPYVTSARTRMTPELAKKMWTPRLTDAEYADYRDYWITDKGYTTPPRIPSSSITTIPRTPTVMPRTPDVTPRTPGITPKTPVTPTTPSIPRTPPTPSPKTPPVPIYPRTPPVPYPKTPPTPYPRTPPPSPKVPPTPVIPKTPVPKIGIPLAFKGDKSKDRFPMDSFGWKQGIGWWVSTPPYSGTIGKDMFFTRTKPAGVPIGRTPAETITKLGINVPKGQKLDLGIMDIQIKKKGSKISYKRDVKQKTKLGSPVGMPPGIVGARGR